MAHTSRRVRHGVTTASRALAASAILAGLTAVIPFALAQEEPPVPGDDAGPAQPVPATEAPEGGDAAPAPPAREAGAASDVEALGWGELPAKVTFVEGAALDAPLARADKPRAQNDWMVQRMAAGAPSTLNVYASDEPTIGAITRHIHGRLIDVDPDYPPNVTGALAVSWEVTDDGRTCTYTLRRGVQFADGRPFTAADVVFSFDVLRDSAVPADHLRPRFDKITSVEAPDDRTVVVKFKSRHWKAPYLIGRQLPILNSAWYGEQLPKVATGGDAEARTLRPGQPGFGAAFKGIRIPCPGTGPYYLAEESDFTARQVNLSANPFSWRMQTYPARHNFNGLRWINLPTEGDAFFAFTHGNLDVWVVSHTAWENQLSRDPRVDNAGSHFVYDHIGIDASAIFWNCRKRPFDDANVRKAMTLMTDRQLILERVQQGHGTIAACKSKRSYPTYSRDIEPWEHDLDAAEVHLIRAGWSRDADGDGILDKDGKPFSFELTYPAGRREFDEIAEILQQACTHLQIDMQLNPVSPKDFHTAVTRKRFDAIVGFGSWADPWIDLFDGYHSSQDARGGGNVSGWHSREVDKLLVAMQAELDETKRLAMHHEFNRIFHDQQPQTLLTHGKVGVLVSKRLEGVSIRPTGLQTFDVWVRPENVRHGKVNSK